VRWLKQGDVWSLTDGSQFEVLWPPKDYKNKNDNNTSLVLLVRLISGERLLLAGDIEAEVEKVLLPSLPKVDVMLMPHHGSKTSSTSPFVEKLQPKIVIAQAGYANHFGFPKVEVVQRYAAAGSTIFNTSNGAVFIDFSAQPMTATQYRLLSATKRQQINHYLFKTKL